jgi:hypothetical protein
MDVVAVLAWLVAATALVAAAVGLFWEGSGASTAYTTLRGETVETYGRGIYAADTLFRGAGFRGSDALTLFVGVPFLLVAVALYRRGSVRGTFLLAGALAYFLYTYASVALGAAYNDLFLLYVAVFSAALFAFVVLLRAVDVGEVDWSRMPRRSIGIFMLASGVLTAAIWLLLTDLLPAVIEGRTPELEGYTTLVTHVLDLGIVVPSVFVAGVLILRRSPLGYLFAIPLLVVEASLLPMIATQTASQVEAGVSFTSAEIIGPIASFCVFGALAVWFLVAALRRMPGSGATRGFRPAGPGVEAGRAMTLGAPASRSRAVEAIVRRAPASLRPEPRREQVDAPPVGRHRAEPVLVRPVEDVRRQGEPHAGAAHLLERRRMREVDVALRNAQIAGGTTVEERVADHAPVSLCDDVQREERVVPEVRPLRLEVLGGDLEAGEAR